MMQRVDIEVSKQKNRFQRLVNLFTRRVCFLRCCCCCWSLGWTLICNRRDRKCLTIPPQFFRAWLPVLAASSPLLLFLGHDGRGHSRIGKNGGRNGNRKTPLGAANRRWPPAFRFCAAESSGKMQFLLWAISFIAINEAERFQGSSEESCGIPPRITKAAHNGSNLVNHFPSGSILWYTCEDSYHGIGITKALCINKDWMGPEMTCKKMCGLPPTARRAYPITDNNNNQTQYPPNFIIKYKCKTGFHEHGSSLAICINGRWKGPKFVCFRQCGAAPLVDLARHDRSYLFPHQQLLFPQNTKLTYTCEVGYVQIGIPDAWCYQGMWRGPFLRCTASPQKIIEMCGYHGGLENGYVIEKVENLMKTTYYSCHKSHELEGNHKRTCLSSGQWSSNIPHCKLKKGYCGIPPIAKNARHNSSMDVKSFAANSTLIYQCEAGFYQLGPNIAKCDAEKGWRGPILQCKPKSCGHPGDIENGYKEGHIYTYMARVYYHCNDGYNLIGQHFKTCQHNAKWDGYLPRCEPVVCPELALPENGAVFGRRTFGSTVKYICYTRYKLVGNLHRKCTINQTWTGEEPVCRESTCRKLHSPQNGKVIGGNKIGSIAKYFCDDGFRLVGPVQRKCLLGERWTGTDPRCEEVSCREPDPLWLGRIDGMERKSGAIIFFECNLNMKFDGRFKSAICMDGKWSAPTPHCYAPCSIPEFAGLSVFRLKWFENKSQLTRGDLIQHGSQVQFECGPGYKPAIPQDVWCSNGTWSKSLQCSPDASETCETPDPPANGKVEVEGLEVDNVAHFSCNPGFRLLGEPKIKCASNGRWSTRLPRCLFLQPGPSESCDDPGIPKNGFRELSQLSIEVGTTATFFCEAGFALKGAKMITCWPEKQWSNPRPKCEKRVHRGIF